MLSNQEGKFKDFEATKIYKSNPCFLFFLCIFRLRHKINLLVNKAKRKEWNAMTIQAPHSVAPKVCVKPNVKVV